MKIERNIKLAKYTTFHVGGPAKFFVEVKSIKDLRVAVEFAKQKRLKIFVLGGGSNLLITDKGINGLVIKMNIKGIDFQGNILTVGAGEIWDKIVQSSVLNNFSGIENLSLVPGTVGGAVYQNIGAYGAELKDVPESVEVFDSDSSIVKTLSNKECEFGYRTSIFQNLKGEQYIILKAVLKLSREFIPNLQYPDLAKYFKESPYHDRDMETLQRMSIADVRKAVIKIRRSKLVYPTENLGTAGSFFKNPIITVAQFRDLTAKYDDIKGRDIGDGLIKLSAGQLIEKAGWKGKKVINVGVSERHALVLVSYKRAKFRELQKLAKKIQNDVKNKFGVLLEPEIKIVV